MAPAACVAAQARLRPRGLEALGLPRTWPARPIGRGRGRGPHSRRNSPWSESAWSSALVSKGQPRLCRSRRRGRGRRGLALMMRPSSASGFCVRLPNRSGRPGLERVEVRHPSGVWPPCSMSISVLFTPHPWRLVTATVDAEYCVYTDVPARHASARVCVVSSGG